MNVTDTVTTAITLDIAAILSAVIWPVIIVALLIIYRKKIPALFEWLSKHVKKIEFQGVSIEMAELKAFVPDWSGGKDFRFQSTSLMINQSMPSNLLLQLSDRHTADYVIVNLRSGKSWLSSRIFIMTILFAQMKKIHAVIFVESTGETRKKFVGWAEPLKIIKAFSRHSPWFEESYIHAYNSVMGDNHQFNITSDGLLTNTYFDINPSNASEKIMNLFLNTIQVKEKPVGNDYQWVQIDAKADIYEHARWINGENIEDLLGKDLNRYAVCAGDTRVLTTRKKLREFLQYPSRFVAVTSEGQRFEYLVDRSILLEQVAKEISAEMDDDDKT